MRHAHSASMLAALLVIPTLTACPAPEEEVPLAEDIYAPLGEILPSASEEQRETFMKGEAVARHRFTEEEGLGPLVNVTFCGSCHEKPVFGGSGGRYRNFYLTAINLEDGSQLELDHGGVLTAYSLDSDQPRPTLQPGVNQIAHRNPIPFFGVGLIAELDEESILENVDEDDADGDGISGRANYDRGFVGRFGRKSQTVSIEGFIRGPFNNHIGLTSDPLTEEQKARLPVPSNSEPVEGFRQAAAPDEPLTDDDEAPDPELAPEDLFNIVSWAMLLAAPEPGPNTAASARGEQRFKDTGCASCHVPSLVGPRGRVPLYSDLLLHDMGDALADGISMGIATGVEFRTQPLWGIAAVAPYLHDGRADTLEEAILWHGGEGEGAREAYEALSEPERADVIAFLESLGGMEQRSDGLLPPDAPIPEAGEPGAPIGVETELELELWLRGREVFDRDMYLSEGLGPYFNGDSCRACHFDPVIGGSGPLDVNVMRYGSEQPEGEFVSPHGGTILSKLSVPALVRLEHDAEQHDVFEPRQTPQVFGLGLIDSIADDTIRGNADPDDLDGDGVRGVVHDLIDGRVGRFSWKGGVPSTREFVRDGMSNELGLTLPAEDGLTFGFLTDEDDIADPELSMSELDAITYYLTHLAPLAPVADVPGGLAAFTEVGCASCHIPELPGEDGPVPLFSDLLLHATQDDGYVGIVDGMANGRMFRTAPLWGLHATAPYMHDGAAQTVTEAIAAHAGEAAASRDAFMAAPAAQRSLIVEFLESL